MSLAWKRERSGGSRGLPLYLGTGSPRAMTRKSSLTRMIFQLSSSSLVCSCQTATSKSNQGWLTSKIGMARSNTTHTWVLLWTLNKLGQFCHEKKKKKKTVKARNADLQQLVITLRRHQEASIFQLHLSVLQQVVKNR